jgi:hypothetical protein
MWPPSSEQETNYQITHCHISGDCNVDTQCKSYKLHSHISRYISECAKIMVKWPTAK